MLSISNLPSSSVDTVAGNDDLLIEIFLRLPINSLIRFKSVSKHWLSLIANPHFSRRRSHRFNTPAGLLLQSPDFVVNCEYDFISFQNENATNPPFRRLTFVDDPSGVQILQSCNGLLCCCTYGALHGICNYYIYNSTTNQFTTIPEPTHRIFNFKSVYAVNLAFDPSKSTHFKVIFIYFSESLYQHYEIDIYSSETGLWRSAGDPFRASVHFRLGVFWNGAMNWASLQGDSLYFNIDEQRLGMIPMPPISDDWEEMMLRCFSESRDHFHLVEVYAPRTTLFNVYEMKRDYSGWFVKFRVDLESVMNAFPVPINRYLDPSHIDCQRFDILSLVRSENDEDDDNGSFLVLQLYIPGMVIRYNFGDNTFKKLCDLPPGHFRSWSLSKYSFSYRGCFEYIESLSCV